MTTPAQSFPEVEASMSTRFNRRLPKFTNIAANDSERFYDMLTDSRPTLDPVELMTPPESAVLPYSWDGSSSGLHLHI